MSQQNGLVAWAADGNKTLYLRDPTKINNIATKKNIPAWNEGPFEVMVGRVEDNNITLYTP